MLVRAHWEKEQDVAGEGDHSEMGQNFSGTNIFVLATRDKHNTSQCKCRSEIKNQVWTVEKRQIYYGVSRPPKPLKAL